MKKVFLIVVIMFSALTFSSNVNADSNHTYISQQSNWEHLGTIEAIEAIDNIIYKAQLELYVKVIQGVVFYQVKDNNNKTFSVVTNPQYGKENAKWGLKECRYKAGNYYFNL